MIADAALEKAAKALAGLTHDQLKLDQDTRTEYVEAMWRMALPDARAAIVAYLRERARQAAPFSDGALVCSKVADELAADGQ